MQDAGYRILVSGYWMPDTGLLFHSINSARLSIAFNHSINPPKTLYIQPPISNCQLPTPNMPLPHHTTLLHFKKIILNIAFKNYLTIICERIK
jgi:hypothetical protein